MLAQKKYSAGFTLIELIVVMGVILLLTGGALAGFGNYNQSQRLKQTAKTFITDLRQAQSKATTGTRSKCSSGTIFGGYSVTFSGTDYTLNAVCDGGNVVDRKVTLPTGISVNANPVTFTFLPLTGAVTATPVPTYPLVITFSQSGVNQIVNISAMGIISSNL